jgi:uncharacterized membrane protein YeaQ/YmgE (transglycosylase-associated protein family)
MSKITNTSELQARIMELGNQRKEESIALKNEIFLIVENLDTNQLLTHGLKEIITSPEVKHELFGLTLGMSAGYIAKKIVIGRSKNILQQIAGNVVGTLVSKNVALNFEKIQATAFFLLKNLMAKKRSGGETGQ